MRRLRLVLACAVLSVPLVGGCSDHVPNGNGITDLAPEKVLGKQPYVGGGEGAFDALGPAAPLLEGRPVQLRADDPRFAEVAAFTDLRTMVGNLLGIHGSIRKGETKTVNGVLALALVDRSDDGVLWVAATGKPYPLRLDAPKPSAARGTAGTVDFLDYDKPVQLTAPLNTVRRLTR